MPSSPNVKPSDWKKSLSAMEYSQLIPELVTLVEEAGAAILDIYESEFSVEIKDDDSPLTQADLASHRIISAGLSRLSPNIPVISEESALPNYGVRRDWNRYWLVDPLDGTKEFVNRNGEFTVNIALIVKNKSQIGIVGVPTQGIVYTGDTVASEAKRIKWVNGERLFDDIGTRVWEGRDSLEVVASRSHGSQRLEHFLTLLSNGFGDIKMKRVGSSLKLCVLSEGNADIYPRLGPTSEWDIAAAHAILSAAGGELLTLSGDQFLYNKESLLNPDFVAVADAGLKWRDQISQSGLAELY